MENQEKKQVKVNELKLGDHVVTLNGDKWKITKLEPCTRTGGLEKEGDFYSVEMQGPNKRTIKNVWHQEAKVLIKI